MTRLFGECDLLAPSVFVPEVLRHIDRWRTWDSHRQAIGVAGQHRFAERIIAELTAQHLGLQFFYLALTESTFESAGPRRPDPFGTREGMWGLLPDTARGYGLDGS